MPELKIASTNATPEIDFSVNQEIQRIKGVSTPIDSVEFYSPLIQWINKNENNIVPNAKFEFELNYFNSSSMKALVWLLQQIEEMILNGKNWSIHWVIVEEDEFMEEAAEAMQTLLQVPVTPIRRS
ncbi:MAG: hypothetical protein RL609_510 [Bacteroidota bacterium]|jgi:hypothetical protein